MLTVEYEFSNEGARAAEHQLRSYLDYANAQMAGDVPNPKGDAALGYVVVRNMADTLKREIDAQDRRVARPVVVPCVRRSVREERGA